MKNKTCGECKWFQVEKEECWHNIHSCKKDFDACVDFKPKVITNGDKLRQTRDATIETVFDHITQSVQTLAEEFVETMYDPEAGEYCYYSRRTAEWYDSREEALAATIEELKKEYKNETQSDNNN